MSERQIDIAQAKEDPAAVFAAPEDVVANAELSGEDKIAILRSWRLDALNLDVATEENMAGGESSMLRRVTLALMSLAGEDEGDSTAPTKQGF